MGAKVKEGGTLESVALGARDCKAGEVMNLGLTPLSPQNLELRNIQKYLRL